MIVLQAFCALAFAPRTLKATVGVLQLLASVCVSSAGAFQTQASSIPVHMHCALTFAARQPNLLMPGGISRPLANPAYVQFWKASPWKRLFFFKTSHPKYSTPRPDRTAPAPWAIWVGLWDLSQNHFEKASLAIGRLFKIAHRQESFRIC